MHRRIRLAELIAALSLAGDLGMGQPQGHATRTAYLAATLADRCGLAPTDRADAFYAALLRGGGCVADAHDMAAEMAADEIVIKSTFAALRYGGSPPARLGAMARLVAAGAPLPQRAAAFARVVGGARRLVPGYLRAHCEVGGILAERIGLGENVVRGLLFLFEEWDGTGPNALRGEDIPLVSRLVHVSSVAEVFFTAAGPDAALDAVRAQSGLALDPELAASFLALAHRPLWSALDSPSFWHDLLALEPAPQRVISDGELDAIAVAFADFADLKSPFTVGHSRGVARLAEDAGRRVGIDAPRCAELRQAALLHDLGRVSVPNSILDKPRALNEAEWERMRLHPYYTERVLARSEVLAPLGPVAGAHHERLDGSGYHRGSRAPQLPPAARVLGAADAYHARTEERPHRPPLVAPEAAAAVRADARVGRLDAEAVEAVLAAASGRPPPRERPPILTARELEVVRLLARARANKEIAGALGISEKTVGRHVENVYEKLGVSTRTGAVMRALARGLLDEETFEA